MKVIKSCLLMVSNNSNSKKINGMAGEPDRKEEVQSADQRIHYFMSRRSYGSLLKMRNTGNMVLNAMDSDHRDDRN